MNVRMYARATLALGACAWFGCAASAEQVGTVGDAITQCSVFDNQTGKTITSANLKLLNDPVAKNILASGTCPTSYTGVLAKLRETDAKDCSNSVFGGERTAGLGTYLVSDTADLVSATQATLDGFRTVTTKTCNGRKPDALMFSAFANGSEHAETSIEMIGKDETTGVYNFYEVIPGGQWVFYGNSFDFVGNGYTCKPSGFCVSNNSKKASSPSGKSCASCHISGGLIMKELSSPWLHWNDHDQDRADAVTQKHADKLGNSLIGEDLERRVIRPSFGPYNAKRVLFLASKGVEELLRPLFCTMDVNLDTDFIGSPLVVDSAIATAPLEPDLKAYAALTKEVGQRVEGMPAKITDTVLGFTYPVRGAIDISYGLAVQEARLVDAELVSDVLNVDFTRPIFSGQRCSLLTVLRGKTAAVDAKLAAFAAETVPAMRRVLAASIGKEIPRLFQDALNAKSNRQPAEQRLLENLADKKADAAAHEEEASTFLTTCNQRLLKDSSKRAALKDMMTYASHLRNVMRNDVVGFNGQDLLEGGGKDNKMVHDNIPDNPHGFDPVDCRLVLPPTQVSIAR